jgi:hypothetical protein
MANPMRGETSLMLGGTYYTLRPSFQAMAEIEHALGRSIMLLMAEHAEGALVLTNMAVILQFGLKAAGTILSHAALMQLLDDAPLPEVIRTIGHFFLNALGVDSAKQEAE